VLLYAHRGASAVAPENTLTAFRRAIDDGADGVELDVRATADGTLVVLHDRDLSRTTAGTGFVDELALDQVLRYDAGGGDRVPTLMEVLDLLSGTLRLDLEVKQPGVEAALLDLLGAYPTAERAISSFDWNVLRTIRALDDEAELWPLSIVAENDLFATAAELKAPAVALLAAGIDEAVIERCEAAGLDVVAWTVNDPEGAFRLRRLGVAAVCTDAPAVLRAAVGALPND
jgi:glycerophosphoryl diester phosphodiesterase